ncbi:hypothetical protein [Anaeromyxobacter dehalogenans]|uniref:Glycosyltransferase RgtA/B/C/D-like domain-containing protein n=1 Tax=Anaeromyxobacter dehalogenans (strain 2CP-C) TaxID=290397 RepID=Q2IGZ6_ANADE|nr:hypothetical protein [Anaeromyxobacter dehalogenans]ABC83855.1 hypothetical protein Adeh_4091 [Anaeromyxobacter dehalogenans 2CP-C]
MRPRALAVVVPALLLVALTLARLPAAWDSGNALNHVSGAWMALADDLAHGTFYRPLASPELGYGGTRFFPLAFALHAGLLRLGAPLLASGYALSLAAGALLVLGGFLLARRMGLARAPAAAFAALALAGFAGQHALSAVRGDLLAVALQALGLAATLAADPDADAPPRPRRGRLALAALCFVLAFAAKPTALTAPAAAVAWLALRRAPRAALGLAAATAAGAATVTLATDLLSHGRFLSILAACAAGGAGPADLLRAPLRLVRLFLVEDRAGLVLVVAAAVALRAAAPRAWAGWRAPAAGGLLLAALWVAAAALGLLAVLASPGTGVNHLLELEAAGASALAAAAGSRARSRRSSPWPGLGAPAAALAGALLAGVTWRVDASSSRLGELRAVVSALPPGPVLSEDPLLPLLAGERPLLLDAWMLRLSSAHDPALARPLLEALRAGAVPAVVLFQDLADPEADAWYGSGNLGAAPVAEIRGAYRRALWIGHYHVYQPLAPAPPRAPGGDERVVLAGPVPAPASSAPLPAVPAEARAPTAPPPAEGTARRAARRPGPAPRGGEARGPAM